MLDQRKILIVLFCHMFTLFFIVSFFEKKNVLTVILSLLTIRKLVAQIEEKNG